MVKTLLGVPNGEKKLYQNDDIPSYEHPVAYLMMSSKVSISEQCDLIWDNNAVSVIAKLVLFRQSRADTWFGSGEVFYSLGANCSSYRFTIISGSNEHWCSNTTFCIGGGFPLPFPIAVIVKKTYAIKQNHLMIDSKSTEIYFFQC